MLNRLDFWITIIVLGMLAWYELRLGRLFGPLARAVYAVFTSSTPTVQRPAPVRTTFKSVQRFLTRRSRQFSVRTFRRNRPE